MLLAYGTVSIRDFKRPAEEPRRFIVESPSRRALFAAVDSLITHDPGAVFTQDQVRAALAALGHRLATSTVNDLFKDETLSSSGRLLRVRRGHFRMRGEDDQSAIAVTGPKLAPIRDYVLAVLRELAAEGRNRVTRAEVQERLAASGTRYSHRAVRQGLLQLRQATPAVVARGPDHRYWLVAR